MKFQNESNVGQGEDDRAHGRWYADACVASFAMELLGERWSMHVLRELMLGPRRFSDIRSALPGISAKVLTQRLARLEAMGALIHRKLPPPAGVQVYELTPWGREAEAVMQALGRWSARSPLHDPTLPLTAVSAMLSLRTMLVAERAGDAEMTIGFALGEDRFLARLSDGELIVERSEPLDMAQAVFRAAVPGAILPLFYGHRPLDEVTAMTGLMVDGDRDAALRFAGFFDLPQKAAAPTSQPASR